MLRALMLAVALATTPALVEDAHAAKPTQEQLDLMKAEVDWAKDTAKAVEKLADDWAKNNEKDKDNAEVERELKSYYKGELLRLRDLGIETVEDPPPPTHPKHPQTAVPDEEEDKEKMEALRDMMVALKGGELKRKEYGESLREYVKILNTRAERKERIYEKEKERED